MPVNNRSKLYVVYDGHCVLCSGTVDFIIRKDKKDLFRFTSLQDIPVTAGLGMPGDTEENESVILIENGKAWYRSTAVLRIMRRLSGGWPLLYLLIVIPAPVRDFFYKFVARRRYKWFGRYDRCPVPDESIREKFTDTIPAINV